MPSQVVSPVRGTCFRTCTGINGGKKAALSHRFIFFCFFIRIVSPLEGTPKMYEYIVRPVVGTTDFVCLDCEPLRVDNFPLFFGGGIIILFVYNRF